MHLEWSKRLSYKKINKIDSVTHKKRKNKANKSKEYLWKNQTRKIGDS